MQVGVSYIDPQWMDVGKDIDAMYTGTMTPDEVFQNIEKRRTEQAQLQKDPAWAE
jgi:raffinose/stachyose/melibiose transport system substrate-binding protein